MKNLTKQKKWLIAATVATLLILVYGMSLTFLYPFKNPVKVVTAAKLASTSMPLIIRTAYYPLYFTVQTCFMVMIYFLLRSVNILKPNEKKTHKILEGIVLLSIFITFFIYWAVLSWNSNVWTNPLHAISSILQHLVIPLMMFVAFFYSHFKSKKTITLSYKDFYGFIIYPLVWLITTIIIYYSTISDQKGLVDVAGTAPTHAQLGNWRLTVNPVSDNWILPPGKVLYKQTFSTGWTPYFFFDFKNTPAWLSSTVTIGITGMFLGLSFLLIAATKPTFKFKKILTK